MRRRPRSGALTNIVLVSKRGRPYDEFQKEWLKKKPPEEILGFYGSWPDAKVIAPVMRP